ncbi:TIGR01777 family protein [Oceanidesulfovibrio indonesiensis]|uniref:TIGR01777 family protein n=1 Tax=Oceanidesulfovibrio indonesiensis TaxID=54767 RepID=A0A7M3MIA7_9BACT|nr:TIGR01777 family oxidoreductase [Oceanidesulfovibrio indonesiensis]TVM18923.1 TIGR01777 family protein [Oceanidesulfovibrio indonesiensis]
MKTVITGGTGFIGGALTRSLLRRGGDVAVITRDVERGRRELTSKRTGTDVERNALERGALTVVSWDDLTAEVDGADAIVNLAGASIFDRRWSEEQKKRIVTSRVKAGDAVMNALAKAKSKPGVLVQGSAVGYYGLSTEPRDENSPNGKGFLADTARKWEDATKDAESMGVRRVIARTGVVLGKGGGALEQFVRPFRFFAGGVIGSGKQWLTWVHIDDEVGAIEFLMDRDDLSGPFNISAPEPETMTDFVRTLGRVLKRPAWLPVPAFVIKAALGEMGEELILSGQRALPARLLESGYAFRFPKLRQAFEDLLS